MALFIAPCFLSTASAQGSPLPAVELDCGSDPVMDVRPTSDAEVSVGCTVTNPTSASEDISIEVIEWDGILVELSLSEDSFTLAAGEDDTFELLFSGQTKLSASIMHEFVIEAKVESWNSLPYGQLPEGPWVANTTYIGDFTIESYGMIELSLSDITTRYMETSEEVEFTFQMTNKGNDDDKLEVVIANAAELEAAGFSFPAGTFISENVPSQGTSSVKTLSIRSPSQLSEDLRNPLIIRAQSGNDDSAQFSEVTIQLDVKGQSQSSGLEGLTSISDDDTIMYAAIGGGSLLLVLFLLVLVRVVRKKPKKQQKPTLKQPIILPEEPEESGAEDDDFDDMFSDLDMDSEESDEFDDLFDDL
ncbi:MAG: hypothetical protein CMA63_01030 [Euryarchaeota archaeon]|nr:hypothetical protein [Euryarchaeota archaeon]